MAELKYATDLQSRYHELCMCAVQDACVREEKVYIERIDGLMGEVAVLKAQVEQLKAPVKFERGEVVRVDNERYHGEGTFEEETLHRYGVMLEHGGIRYYEPETVHKLAARAAAPATGAEQKDGD